MGTLGNLLDSFSEQWPEVHPWGEESKAGFPVCRLHPFPPGLILAHWGAARGAQKPLVRGPCQLCWEAEKARLHGRVARWSHL